MRFRGFEQGSALGIAVDRDSGPAIDLLAAWRDRGGAAPEWTTLSGLIALGPAVLELARSVARDALDAGDFVLDTEDISWLPALTAPPRIFCIGRNYAEHAKEGNAEVPDTPMIFFKPATSLIGDGAPIVIPASTDRVDWEAELAVIIGVAGRDIPEESALDHVAGYSIANDVTARDWQRRTSQFDAGKMFDTFCPLGPGFAAAADFDPSARAITTRVNGELMQDGNTSDMIFSSAHLISYLSQAVRLVPGDVILSGTPSGVGYARTPPVYLVPGDVVEVTVEGLGTLRNPVITADTARNAGLPGW
jgi:2-keto-4-pentenoate hydratase/2-oxohepta-3-ene-1,7-dioic acid hydratase in catechol pathway